MKQHSNKTDIWSLGLVFINLIIVDWHNLDQPTDFTIPNDSLEALRLCICNKMIVVDDKNRATIGQVIEDEAFRNHFPFVEAKAKAWENEEALDEMKSQHLQQQIEKLTETISNFKNELARKDEQIEELKETISLIKIHFEEELAKKGKQINDLIGALSNNHQEGNESKKEAEKTSQLSDEMNSKLKLTKPGTLLFNPEIHVDMESQVGQIGLKYCCCLNSYFCLNKI